MLFVKIIAVYLLLVALCYYLIKLHKRYSTIDKEEYNKEHLLYMGAWIPILQFVLIKCAIADLITIRKYNKQVMKIRKDVEERSFPSKNYIHNKPTDNDKT